MLCVPPAVVGAEAVAIRGDYHNDAAVLPFTRLPARAPHLGPPRRKRSIGVVALLRLRDLLSYRYSRNPKLPPQPKVALHQHTHHKTTGSLR
jgi:hypothetical protein